jgi:uncharacterized protein YbaR (Trm112 family)
MTDATTSDAERLGISPDLLAILVCPADHGKLKVDKSDLVCDVCGRRYEVRDGIPDMVIE